MKNKIILQLFIFFLAINATFSQDTIYNFSVVKNEIVWQKVYESTLSFAQLDQQIRNSGLFEEIEREGTLFRGWVKNLFPINNLQGYNLIPTFISANYVNCFVVIEHKEGRYRVSIKNIVLTSRTFGTEAAHTVNSLEKHAFLRGYFEFSNPFIRSGADILDFTFDKKFDFSVSGEDW